MLRQKLAYIALGGLLVFGLQLSSQIIVDNAAAQGDKTPAETTGIKFLYSIDYPVGKKAEYLEWIKTVADSLQAPEEVKRIASYDNYYSASPHRFVEFEFDNMEAATKYFEREELRPIFDDVVNHQWFGQN